MAFEIKKSFVARTEYYGPPGVEVHGLVLDHVIYRGWRRRWRRLALRVGMWLVRRSGCEVVKP